MGRFNFTFQPPAPPSAPADPEVEAPRPEPMSMFVEEPPPADTRAAGADLLDIKLKLHARLIDELDLAKLETMDPEQMRRQVRGIIGEMAKAERLALNMSELDALSASIIDEMVGLGPLEPLLKDDSIADILINGPYQ